jgi:hypothetical protein
MQIDDLVDRRQNHRQYDARPMSAVPRKRPDRTSRHVRQVPSQQRTFCVPASENNKVAALEPLNQHDDAWKPLAKKIPIVIARTICVTMTLNTHLLASLNAIYKIDYLFDPSTAGTMETGSVARIVVFAIVRGETVPFCRCISMPKIYMQPTFD